MRRFSVACVAICVACLLFSSQPSLAAGAAVAAESVGGPSLVVREGTKTEVLRGYTRASGSVGLTAEVGGRVTAVNYEVGQAVGREPFIQIDTTFVDLSIESVEKQMQRLGASRQRAESHVRYLEKEFGRLEKLFNDGRASEARYDASVQQLEQARLELDAVSAEHGALNVTIRELKERRRRHSVRARRGWVITGRLVEPGEVVAPGQPLGRASDFSSLVVPLAVSLDELNAIKAAGRELSGRLEGVPVSARLNWENPDFDERTRKSSVEIALINTTGVDARGGLSFELPLSVRAEGLRVPRAAVSWRYENPRVTVRVAGRPTGRTVSLIVIDESGDDLVVASDGSLKPGDELFPAGAGTEGEPAKTSP